MKAFLLLLFCLLAPRASANSTYELATFNAALTRIELVGNYAERKEALLKKLVNATVDVLCLQEVWLGVDIDDVIKAAMPNFPYSHRLSPVPGGGPPCESGPLFSGYTCGTTNCASAFSRGVLNGAPCLVEKCGDELRSLPQACLNCLINSKSDDLLKCASVNKAVSYESTHGLVLLSKHRLSNRIERNYTEPLVRDIEVPSRGFIAADVNGLGTVVCTQLEDYSYPGIAYVGPKVYSSARQEQNASLGILLNAFSSSSDKPTYLLGDFNHGPSLNNGTVAPLFADFYERVLSAGFVSPATTLNNCSLCRSNSLETFEDYTNITIDDGFLLDHVYVPRRLASKVVSAQRRHVGNADGLTYPLSNHYAVSVVVQGNDFFLPTTPAAPSAARQTATPSPSHDTTPSASSSAVVANVALFLLFGVAASTY